MDPPAVIQVPAKLVIGGRFREGCVRKQLVCLFDLRMQQQVTEHEIEKGSLRVDVPAKTGHVVRLGHDLSQRQDDGGVLHGIGDQGTVSVEASQEGIERGDRSAETGGNLPGGHRDVFQEDGNAGFDQGHRLRVFFFLPQYADPEAQQPGLDLPAGGRREIAGILRRLALDVHGRRRRRRRIKDLHGGEDVKALGSRLHPRGRRRFRRAALGAESADGHPDSRWGSPGPDQDLLVVVELPAQEAAAVGRCVRLLLLLLLLMMCPGITHQNVVADRAAADSAAADSAAVPDRFEPQLRLAVFDRVPFFQQPLQLPASQAKGSDAEASEEDLPGLSQALRCGFRRLGRGCRHVGAVLCAVPCRAMLRGVVP
mmetsp:Transcript_14338/g.32199  ORF Transcript_14338/g.32199 Transcript_14338/m.32199 type:complete len:369 (-) Transcript_14338:95-1201(-)